MKKIFLLFFIILLCGCQNKYSSINYETFYKKLKLKNSYTLLLCDKDCLKYKDDFPNIYYMDINTLSDKEILMIESLVFNFNPISTPTIVLIENGIIKDKTNDLKSENIEKFLNK